MIVLISLAIPVPAAAALYWKFHHRITLWEAALMLGTPVVLVVLAKALVETAQTSDTEWWGGYVTTAEHYEDWNERVSCRHEIDCTHYDKEGNQKHSNDGYEHSYDVDYHPEHWLVNHSLRGEIGVSRPTFERLAAQFGNRKFVELHRDYHTNDGDKYVATWKGEPERIEPVTLQKSYENRVQASSSILNFQPVTPEEAAAKGLHDYPKVSGYAQRAILGNAGATTAEAERKFQHLNATLGAPHQVRLYVLVFRDRAISAATEQEAYWKRGNKNEFVSCVGVDGENRVLWSYVFSWTDSEIFKVEARDFLAGQKTLDLAAYADWLGPAVREKWVRKKFEEFSYITVDPPLWAVITTFFVTLAVCAGVAVWAVLNEHRPERPASFGALSGRRVKV